VTSGSERRRIFAATRFHLDSLRYGSGDSHIVSLLNRKFSGCSPQCRASFDAMLPECQPKTPHWFAAMASPSPPWGRLIGGEAWDQGCRSGLRGFSSIHERYVERARLQSRNDGTRHVPLADVNRKLFSKINGGAGGSHKFWIRSRKTKRNHVLNFSDTPKYAPHFLLRDAQIVVCRIDSVWLDEVSLGLGA